VSVSDDELNCRVEAMKQALRQEGLRLTHQRLEIVKEIAGTDEHPDVECIYRGVRTRVPTVSLDTVYRTLGTLAERGLISRVVATAGPARYDANTRRHHHFVCTRCGKVRDVADPGLDAIRVPRATSGFGTVETVEVQLRGVCHDCAASDAS
jgi:Fur family peroxide stress response transcriptional regulator